MIVTLQFEIPKSDDEIAGCFPLLRELRPMLTGREKFVAQIRRQQDQGYRLLTLQKEGQVVACAGYRFLESLIRGRFLYIDDLVTTEVERGRGYGERLLKRLCGVGRKSKCRSVVLASGVGRHAAHRFYFRHGFAISAYQFTIPLDNRRSGRRPAMRRRASRVKGG